MYLYAVKGPIHDYNQFWKENFIKYKIKKKKTKNRWWEDEGVWGRRGEEGLSAAEKIHKRLKPINNPITSKEAQ